MKLVGKVLVHGCDIPGFNNKIELRHQDEEGITVLAMIKGKETYEAWFEEGCSISIHSKFNSVDGVYIYGGVLTDIQCVYDKNLKAIQTIVTYDNSKEMYEELIEFTKGAVEVDKPSEQQVDEHRMHCKVCGHIYCYTDKDVRKNDENTLLSAVSAVGSLAAAFGGGTRLDVYAQQRNANRYSDRIIDYKRCPNCNSTDIEPFTGNAEVNEQGSVNAAVEEIKRYKELLDLGILTPEEFAAKKKQVLGISDDSHNSDNVSKKNTAMNDSATSNLSLNNAPQVQQYCCPNCNGIVLYGEPLCKNCGTQFNWQM